jgi:hypothetical protein
MPSLDTIRRKALKLARDPSMLVRFVRDRLLVRLANFQRDRTLGPHQRIMLGSLGTIRPTRVDADGPIEVHILCGRATVTDALAMLGSFYDRARVTYPLVIHEDGSFGDVERARFARHFPGARIILRRQADVEVPALLNAAGLHRCAAFRREQIYALKIFDLQHYGRGKRVLYVDTDVLFFTRPDALIDALNAPDDQWVDRYNEDVRNCYTWPAEQVRRETGIELLPRVNSGLLAVRLGAPNWAMYESWLGMPERSFFTEQSLWAIHLSAVGARPLPSEYDVCFRHAWEGTDWNASLAAKRVGREVVTEHFCGGLGCRVLFYERFMQRVAGTLEAAG